MPWRFVWNEAAKALSVANPMEQLTYLKQGIRLTIPHDGMRWLKPRKAQRRKAWKWRAHIGKVQQERIS